MVGHNQRAGESETIVAKSASVAESCADNKAGHRDLRVSI